MLRTTSQSWEMVSTVLVSNLRFDRSQFAHGILGTWKCFTPLPQLASNSGMARGAIRMWCWTAIRFIPFFFRTLLRASPRACPFSPVGEKVAEGRMRGFACTIRTRISEQKPSRHSKAHRPQKADFQQPTWHASSSIFFGCRATACGCACSIPHTRLHHDSQPTRRRVRHAVWSG